MIDQLKSLAIFVAVVEAKSFRAAAQKLSLSPSVVSHHVSQLEKKIGAALLYRSTRALSLTREGEQLYKRALKMVSAANTALGLFSEQSEEKLIELTIAIPITFSAHPLFGRLAKYALENSGIMINLVSSDTRRSVLGEGYDLAVQMGRIKDSELKVKKIGDEIAILVATPDYIASQPIVESPADLSEWDFIGFSPVAESLETDRDGKDKQKYWGKTCVRADSIETVRWLALSGLGAANIPASVVEPDIIAGNLAPVLQGWSNKEIPIYLVWPKNTGRGSATRALIDYMSAGKE